MSATGHIQHSPQTPASTRAGVPRQPYHQPHLSLGATEHWIKTAGILAPLIIGEFVKDSEQRWRYIRIASVATALLSEGLWTHKIHNERKEAQERERACLERA